MFSNLKQLLVKAGWAPVSVLLVHNTISSVYGHKPGLDPPMHLLGGAAMAYFFYQVLTIWATAFGKSKQLARLVMAFCFATTVAVFWEFIEFTGGELSGISAQHSLRETMQDLILGCTGAFIYLAINGALTWIIKRNKVEDSS